MHTGVRVGISYRYRYMVHQQLAVRRELSFSDEEDDAYIYDLRFPLMITSNKYSFAFSTFFPNAVFLPANIFHSVMQLKNENC